jgi:SAM-dependent methyltransferase
VGLDLAFDKVREGKKHLNQAEFIQASSQNLPFRNEVFDKVICLELLEHLENPAITVDQIDYTLKKKGVLVASVPYRERIFMTTCIHCGKLTPHYGHVQSFDEKKITRLLSRYRTLSIQALGSPLASYIVFSPLPQRIWRILDRVFTKLPAAKPAWLLIKVQKKASVIRTRPDELRGHSRNKQTAALMYRS